MYKDSEYKNNNNLSPLQNKKNLKLRIEAVLLSLAISVTGTLDIYATKELVNAKIATNPFDGSQISTSFLETDVKYIKVKSYLEDEKFIDIIKDIRQNSNINEKKAYVLYYAILENQDLTEEEKNVLSDAIRYFSDNPYIDAEYVYEQLSKINIIKRNATFPGTNISSMFSYSMDAQEKIVYGGEIKLGNEKDLFHEYIMHGTSKNHTASWIEEGYASIIDAEYHSSNDSNYLIEFDSYPVEASIIRFLCEIMGKEKGRECFFKIHAGKFDSMSTSLELLTSYLVNCGITQELCQELYLEMNNFSQYRCKILNDEEEIEERKVLECVVGILAKMYDMVNDNKQLNNIICSEYISDILYKTGINLSIDKYYYFNSKEINKYPNPITIEYYYPYEESNQILTKRVLEFDFLSGNLQYLSTARQIDDVKYVLLKEKEFSMCDESKII